VRIELDLPDWGEEEKRHTFIFYGMELVAYKLYGSENWKVKAGRCSKCGECCKKARCEYLVKDGGKLLCSFGSDRPFSCSAGVQQGKDGCTEHYDTLL
jgi:hypothetical protein